MALALLSALLIVLLLAAGFRTRLSRRVTRRRSPRTRSGADARTSPRHVAAPWSDARPGPTPSRRTDGEIAAGSEAGSRAAEGRARDGETESVGPVRTRWSSPRRPVLYRPRPDDPSGRPSGLPPSKRWRSPRS